MPAALTAVMAAPLGAWRMAYVPCAACHELTARAYLRVVGDKHVCIPCSGYER